MFLLYHLLLLPLMLIIIIIIILTVMRGCAGLNAGVSVGELLN